VFLIQQRLVDVLHEADDRLPRLGRLTEQLGAEVEDGGAVALVQVVPRGLADFRVLQDSEQVGAVGLRREVLKVHLRRARLVRVNEKDLVNLILHPREDGHDDDFKAVFLRADDHLVQPRRERGEAGEDGRVGIALQLHRKLLAEAAEIQVLKDDLDLVADGLAEDVAEGHQHVGAVYVGAHSSFLSGSRDSQGSRPRRARAAAPGRVTPGA
jgi:hypothetical protein